MAQLSTHPNSNARNRNSADLLFGTLGVLRILGGLILLSIFLHFLTDFLPYIVFAYVLGSLLILAVGLIGAVFYLMKTPSSPRSGNYSLDMVKEVNQKGEGGSNPKP